MGQVAYFAGARRWPDSEDTGLSSRAILCQQGSRKQHGPNTVNYTSEVAGNIARAKRLVSTQTDPGR